MTNIENARNIVFHFNKKSIEDATVPSWVIKAKGETFYVNHVTCNVPWTTKETPDNASTKGAIKISRGDICIDDEGHCIIT